LGAYKFEKYTSSKYAVPFPEEGRDCVGGDRCGFKYKSNAMKLSNLDAAVNFDLSRPPPFIEGDCSNNNNDKASSSSSVFYFGEIWVQSKGFREYGIYLFL
jgi:hypothetical protein